jgi:hypothetical protein
MPAKAYGKFHRCGLIIGILEDFINVPFFSLKQRTE